MHSTMWTPSQQDCLPGARHTAVTASEDGTLRVWDTTTVGQRTVVKPSVDRPGRVPVTACAYGDEGALLAAGLASGTIQLWDIKGGSSWSRFRFGSGYGFRFKFKFRLKLY